jgi:hypothetical protein
MDLPAIAVIPGSFNLPGNLQSPVGPLAGATIRIGINGTTTEATSANDGSFDARIGMGMGFNLFGSQDMEIAVIPAEPWHSPLLAERKLLVLNVINCGGILLVMVLAGITLRGRIGAFKISWPRKNVAILPAATAASATPEYSREFTANIRGGTPRQEILRRYRGILQMVQKATRKIIPPQKTLREFVHDVTGNLGPVNKYLLELTSLVERLLYSSYQPGQADSLKNIELKDNIEKGLNDETG